MQKNLPVIVKPGATQSSNTVVLYIFAASIPFSQKLVQPWPYGISKDIKCKTKNINWLLEDNFVKEDTKSIQKTLATLRLELNRREWETLFFSICWHMETYDGK